MEGRDVREQSKDGRVRFGRAELVNSTQAIIEESNDTILEGKWRGGEGEDGKRPPD